MRARVGEPGHAASLMLGLVTSAIRPSRYSRLWRAPRMRPGCALTRQHTRGRCSWGSRRHPTLVGRRLAARRQSQWQRRADRALDVVSRRVPRQCCVGGMRNADLHPPWTIVLMSAIGIAVESGAVPTGTATSAQMASWRGQHASAQDVTCERGLSLSYQYPARRQSARPPRDG